MSNSKVKSEIAEAKRQLASEALYQFISEVTDDTSWGDIVAVLAESNLDGLLSTMTIGEIVEARTKPRPTSGPQERDTRTRAGRLALDTAVSDFLKTRAGAQDLDDVRDAVNATTPQVQQSLTRLMKDAKVIEEREDDVVRFRWCASFAWRS